MACSQCEGIEAEFNQGVAAQKLADYHRHGPARTTRLLLAALQDAGVSQQTLLDVGGGIGVIQLELLKRGLGRAISVDASPAYVQAAREEARRQGLGDRIDFHPGNLVDLAPEIPPVDIVTLDRVICCYPDLPALVGLSADSARRLFGLVYPRDAAWVRWAVRIGNLFQRVRGSPFRIFAHRTADVEGILGQRGFQRRFSHLAGFWQVAVYAR
jgi:hypothetical protein